MADSIQGTVLSIVFRNEQNGYTVLTLDDPDDTTAVGILPFVAEGTRLRLFGEWRDHADYGRQFQVDRFETLAPRDADAIRLFLSSGQVKGIGVKTAARLVDRFGADTLRVLREDPETVAGIKGIGSDKAASIARQLNERQDFQELMLLLAPLGIGAAKALRIYKHFGGEALRVAAQDPYLLADEVHGIGFRTADRLALGLGIRPDSPGRIRSGLAYLLNEALGAGHCWYPREDLTEMTMSLLGFQDELRADVELAIERHPELVCYGSQLGDDNDQRIALGWVHQMELGAATRLAVMCTAKPRGCPDLCDPDRSAAMAVSCGADLELELAEEQRQALLAILRQPVMILTGGPGTGKTTIIRLLCDCFERVRGKVLLAAPTGRAAKRMQEASGREASTLHRLLEIRPADDRLNADSLTAQVRLDCDLLIVDEASMIDLFLLCSVLEATPPGTRLLLVGDVDQLPSVGPGDVLRDLIGSGLLPVSRLTTVFRQSRQSLIIRNAHRIHAGLWPEIDQSKESEFIYVARDDAGSIAGAAVRLLTDVLPNQYGYDPNRDVQVLTPWRKGPAGTIALNQTIQERLNAAAGPEWQRYVIRAHGYSFRPGDKVMQTRNNYDLAWHAPGEHPLSSGEDGSGVFNGETGIVTGLDLASDSLTVQFDDGRIVEYDRASLDDLDLAYAITVHKSQGSEYPVVILCLPSGAPQLLTRNLLYTAVTRARFKLLLLARRQTLQQMLKNETARRRYTSLGDWLCRSKAKRAD